MQHTIAYHSYLSLLSLVQGASIDAPWSSYNHNRNHSHSHSVDDPATVPTFCVSQAR
jgi:hypothetical protein